MRHDLRTILALASPVVLAELGWMSMSLVDTIMVGGLGPAAIGAVGIGNILFYTIAVSAMGMLLGLDTLVSQAFGAGDLQDCDHSLWQAVYLGASLAMPALLLLEGLVLLAPSWGIRPEVIALLNPYEHALRWGMPALLLYAAFRRYLQGMSLVKPVTFAVVSANIVNAVGNWLLIYGAFGAPRLGVEGSGWATFLARVYMLAVLVAYVLWRECRSPTGLLKAPPPVDWVRQRLLLRLGAPAATQLLLEYSVFGIATVFAGRLSAASLAAHHIALNAASMAYMVPLGISSAGAVSVGQAIGRGDLPGARRAGWIAISLGLAFMLAASFTFWFAPDAILRIYTNDPTTTTVGIALLAVAAVFQLFDGLQVIGTGVLRGAGDTRTSMLTNLVGHWLLGLPIGWWLCFVIGWGVTGLWIGLSIGLITVGAVLLAVWARRSERLALRAIGQSA